jgi:hypothetical protein
MVIEPVEVPVIELVEMMVNSGGCGEEDNNYKYIM